MPNERILRRYVRRRRRAHGFLIIVVVRERGTTVVRGISGAQEMLTPSIVHRTPNRVDYHDGSNEKQRKRESTEVNEQKRGHGDGLHARSVYIIVDGVRSRRRNFSMLRERNDYSGRSSEMSIDLRRSLRLQGYGLRRRVPN